MLPEKGELLLKMVKPPEIKEEIRADMVCQIYLVILPS
jgi:hypothetical protein